MDRRLVHVAEVAGVGRVLEGDLRVHGLAFELGGELGIGAVVAVWGARQLGGDVEHARELPGRQAAVRVVPHEDALVLLQHRPGLEALGDVGAILVGDVFVLAIRAPAPAVIGAFDAVTVDGAVVSQVGAQVQAVAVEDVELAFLGAVRDEVLAEVVQRLDRARRDLRAPADHEPPHRTPGERDLHQSTLGSRADVIAGRGRPGCRGRRGAARHR